MSDSPYDVDGALKWAETSRKMNAGAHHAAGIDSGAGNTTTYVRG